MNLLILLLFTLATPLSALAISEQALEARQLHISAQHGGQDSLIATAQDQEGYLWLASIHGLFVYDGGRIRPALQDELNGTRINDLHISADDTVWIATNSGVLSYSLQTQKHYWNHFIGMAKADANSASTLYEDRKGRIWAGTLRGGLFRLEPSFNTFERISLDFQTDDKRNLSVLSICEDASRNMWLATSHGVIRLDGHHEMPSVIPLPTGAPYHAREITCDGSGNIWVAIPQRGLWRYSSQTNTLLPVHDFPATSVHDLFTDSHGDVWIATDLGLYRYVHKEKTFNLHPLYIQGEQIRLLRDIASVYETSDGTLWIGTFNHGAFFTPYPSTKLLRVVLADDPDPENGADFRSVFNSADSRFYVVPRKGGLYRSQPLSIEALQTTSALVVDKISDVTRVTSIAVNNGTVICGSQNKFTAITPHHQPQTFQIDSQLDIINVDNSPRTFQFPLDGRIWFAHRYGLYSWKHGEELPRKESTLQSPLPSMTLVGNTLLLSQSRSIMAVDIPTKHISNIQLSPTILENNATLRMLHAETAERLWVSTSNSLYRMNLRTGSADTIFQRSGESLANTLSINFDATGSAWAQTVAGIFMIPPGSTQAEEMISAGIHPDAMFKSALMTLPGGAMICGHTHGIMLFSPERLTATPRLHVKISDVRIFEKSISVLESGRLPAILRLDHEHNFLSFSFASPQWRPMHPLRYQFMLDGIDTDWIDAGDRTSISYAHLQPGQYTFRLRDRSSTAQQDAINIAIEPPWWQTPWMRSIYVVAGCAAIWTGIMLTSRFQTARIRKDMLENLIMQDPLTEIPNRRKFAEVLTQEKSRCKRLNHMIALIMVDIDYFKGFNDTFGHQAGDRALRSVARALQQTLKRPEDFVARYGGEEFVLVLPSTAKAGAERVAEKIRDAISDINIPYPKSPVSDRLTVSMGISIFSPQTDLHIDSGMFSADQALYQAKRRGRNCVFFKEHCLSLTPAHPAQEQVHTA